MSAAHEPRRFGERDVVAIAAMTPWTVLSDKLIADRRWLRVHEQSVLLPNGTRIDEFHLLESPSWVAVLPVTQTGSVILVQQYRHGLGQVSRELPAGVIDPGETPSAAAERELLEETGYVADDIVPLIELYPEPHRSTHCAHFFVAHDVRYSGRANPEPSEVLEVISQSRADLIEDALSGRIRHAAHTAAILVAHARGLI